MKKPSFREEKKLWSQDIKYVIGVDEVGRGAFAGPIVAAGVIYTPSFDNVFLDEIKDSKQLSSNKRDYLSILIKKHCDIYTIEQVELDFINKHGIGMANKKVIEKVINKLVKKIKRDNYYALIDGRFDDLDKQKGLIKGDTTSITIASASIIAKVYRDNLMVNLSKKFPEYDLSNNKGYGTLKHREAIKKNGLTKIHRISFNLNKFT